MKTNLSALRLIHSLGVALLEFNLGGLSQDNHAKQAHPHWDLHRDYRPVGKVFRLGYRE